ncbi:MAG: 3-deoxy-7-phosphoheptulonate synthase class II [Actinomycetota bacterium]|nr:3-deoxy-7-phosphoheptulonate synthase class II [Acidimicrobiales bacterium]MEC8983596.1 3-deoxy-7-phosphoheptulonate synthase class II [Actinomycetota bacterium]MEC9450332.1 3-deoxy-7-phosphoheptulonate synthase class II [Actinomycetota bacterium]MED5165713.1 3-deoxy-7-phosphoheptulonate synthase class II [Actinomycetota bacterium]MED5232575.1 3-deoxy-7-phosphoheptulonate synthase class II [Actinomycetota bacterium]
MNNPNPPRSKTDWTPQSWRDRVALQQPQWPDAHTHRQVLDQLSALPPLVFAGEARELTEQLAAVSEGRAFLLQAGDCAESFDTSADSIRDRLRVILQMAVILTYYTGVPVVKVGRIAGQFAKPRSSDTETVDGVELPSFRGHIVNDIGFTADERAANPKRLLLAYNRAAATLNLLRAFTKGGFASLSRVHQWNREFVADSPAGQRYENLADEIDRAVQFMSACGVNSDTLADLRQVDFYTSHEALLLDYEEALTRSDSLTDDWYDCSAHMLWIGERTRQLDGAHVEFLRGVGNPLGCKLGPSATVDDVLALCRTLNPDDVAGRLTLVTRMGATRIVDDLPPLLDAVKTAGHPVVWACDPMHGNTFTADDGRKTRHFDDVLAEVSGFFAAHRFTGTHPGGVHLELTGDDVTECLGGGAAVETADLGSRYETMCDPRLNGSQSLDLAFRLAELLRNGTR